MNLTPEEFTPAMRLKRIKEDLQQFMKDFLEADIPFAATVVMKVHRKLDSTLALYSAASRASYHRAR